MDQSNKSKIRVFLKKIWFVLYTIVFSIAIGFFIVTIGFVVDETKEKNKKLEMNKLDFKERFVIFKEGKDNVKSIILDIENGCLYVGENGVIQSPLIKDKQFDCDIKYIEEYKNKSKQGDKK